jgi:hypothetical protein
VIPHATGITGEQAQAFSTRACARHEGVMAKGAAPMPPAAAIRLAEREVPSARWTVVLARNGQRAARAGREPAPRRGIREQRFVMLAR